MSFSNVSNNLGLIPCALTTCSGGGGSGNGSGVSYYSNQAGTLSNIPDPFTAITWNANLSGLITDVTQTAPTEFTINTTGTYLIDFTLNFFQDNDNTNNYSVYSNILINGSAGDVNTYCASMTPIGATYRFQLQNSKAYSFSAGDTINIIVAVDGAFGLMLNTAAPTNGAGTARYHTVTFVKINGPTS